MSSDTGPLKRAIVADLPAFLSALGIDPASTRGHIDCPLPGHGGKDDFRIDAKTGSAVCTCLGGSFIDCLELAQRIWQVDFPTAKRRTAEAIGRLDLIEPKGKAGTKSKTRATGVTKAERALNPPAKRVATGRLITYLARRVGRPVDELVLPSTRLVGDAARPLYVKPEQDGGDPVLIGEFPCLIFEAVANDGRIAAHQIFITEDATAKASIQGPDGEPIKPKKWIGKERAEDSLAGCSVWFGDRNKAKTAYLLEGIEDAAAVAVMHRSDLEAGRAAVAAAIATAGVENFAPPDQMTDLVIVADRDERANAAGKVSKAGERAARKLAAMLHKRVNVRIALPGNGGEKSDVLAMVEAEGWDATAERIANAEAFEPSEDELTEGDHRDQRVEITLAEDRANQVLRQCAEVLRDQLYLRETVPTMLVRVADTADPDEEGRYRIRGVDHDPDALVFIEPTADRVQYLLDDRVLFRQYSRSAETYFAKACPPWIGKRIVSAAAMLRFRQCDGISTTPIFDRGKIIADPGYNTATRTIINIGFRLLEIPAQPIREQALRAVDVVLRPFRGYLQGLEGDGLKKLRCALLASALTAGLRASLSRAPAVVFDANFPGAGKGKAARATAAIATGRRPSVITEGTGKGELEKRITAAVLSGSPVFLLDNLQQQLASTTLESMLTEGLATIRLFNTLTDVTVPCSALVLITANQASLREDMLRRVLTVRIVVDTDEPELRRFDFDPVQEVLENRPAIVAAVLTIAVAWWQHRETEDGRRIRRTTLGSFEDWSELVAGAVEWLIGMNPVKLIEAKKAEETAGSDSRAVITAIAAFQRDRIIRQQSTAWRARDAASEIDAETWANVIRFKGEKPSAREVGDWLRAKRDQVFAVFELDDANADADSEQGELVRYRLTGNPDRKGITEWTLTPLDSAGSPGHAGSESHSNARNFRETSCFTGGSESKNPDFQILECKTDPARPGDPAADDEEPRRRWSATI